MNRTPVAAMLAGALLGTVLAEVAYFYGKRLRAEDLEGEQDYKISGRRLARGLAVLVAIGFLVTAATDPDEEP